MILSTASIQRALEVFSNLQVFKIIFEFPDTIRKVYKSRMKLLESKGETFRDSDRLASNSFERFLSNAKPRV